jgi:hypothetical protein
VRAHVQGVIGLDLSLTSAAAAWVPMGWTGNTKVVVVGGPWGYPLTNEATREDAIDRMISIAESVVNFCIDHPAVNVYVENYAFSQASSSATTLRELGGIVKREFRKRTGSVPIPVTASAARKTLLQKLPKAKLKDFTEQNVRRLKGEALYWNGDQIDAVVIANHGAMLQGWTPLSFPGTP